ncbi:cytochrome C oxidase Cbb3 [Akkermansiaceae bacterium]|nr:cytochrome C oxidase Cbb3 [Akkermansiaceae bacterium]
MKRRIEQILGLHFFLLAFPALAQETLPPTSVPIEETMTPVFGEGQISGRVEAAESYSNFRMVLDYDSDGGSRILLGDGEAIKLPVGKGKKLEIAYEHCAGSKPHLRVGDGGKILGKGRDLGAVKVDGGSFIADAAQSDDVLRLDADFTAMVAFNATEAGGTLFSKSMPAGKWVADAKALFVRNGNLVFDIGWVGALEAKSAVVPGKDHLAVLVSEGGKMSLFVDGKMVASKAKFTAADPKGSVFKVASAADDFGGDFGGAIAGMRYWKRALGAAEIALLSSGREGEVNTPDLNWAPVSGGLTSYGAVSGYAVRPVLEAGKGFFLRKAFVQPLALEDHAEIIRGWDDAKAWDRGDVIYNQLCVTCHGTIDNPGSLPTAPRFHLGEIKNGADPYRMLQTLEKGYGQMMPMPQYNTRQKYEVINYLRGQFLEGKNPEYFTPVDDAYLAMLPRGMTQRREAAAEEKKKEPIYKIQDHGNALFWTLQVEPGNIAQKGIAIRVDAGPGGVSAGKAWMLYEHDTMRLAAAWTGDKFVDWKGIGFDGSHGTHTSIVGEKDFVFPNEPMWANPETGDFKDLRILGRDGLPYGPLPREWVQFKGMEMQGETPVIRYSVGDCEIREVPGLSSDGAFVRWLYMGPHSHGLKIRLDTKTEHIIPASAKASVIGFRFQSGAVSILPADQAPAAPGEPASKRFTKTLTTEIKADAAQGAWAVDTLETPATDDNPWHSWMRTSGFDFFEGGKSAAICTWDGDVWIVDGIDQAEGQLKWQRVCAGLFQPLGLKIVDGKIYVGCRDMIALLHDLDGDRETDYIESFNSDHQVTEHFHEFAMGLQTDAAGNFYYAKSARHGKPAVIPHHGTLLKVSKDGKKTEILATGFRAANGVCLNPDGTFIVTDQEGHWNPKNRINWVTGKGPDEFYGNIYGYHNVTDESDSAMIQPLCWITNAMDRSPAELLWVPENSAWEPLRGSLLNLSYGTGKIYTVPFEETSSGKQGGMCPLPIAEFPTGVMRGRFSPADGQFYGCGMYAWAGNRSQPGGFYRVRYTGKPAHQPVVLKTAPGSVTIGFSDPLEKTSAEATASWAIEAWDLKRTANYGSRHLNQREWKVSKATLSADGKSVTLSIPDLAPTWGMSIKMSLQGAGGEPVVRELHNSIFNLD